MPDFLNRRRLGFTYPLRVVEELGIDRPALNFVIAGVALRPDDGARMPELFNPYSANYDHWAAPAAEARGAGLVDEVGDRWRATAKGRDLFKRVRAEADRYLATLTPIAKADIQRLAELLGRALTAIERSGVPKDHMGRIPYFRGDPSIPMVALENAVMGLWLARDDCHMASWREAGFDGPIFDVLTRVWRDEAKTEEELATKLTTQKPADVSASLAKLRKDGLLQPDTLAVTDRGRKSRQAIEDQTDAKFFSPWPDDVGAQGAWISERLGAINTALAPAS